MVSDFIEGSNMGVDEPDVGVLLTHADHHTLMTGASNNRATRGVNILFACNSEVERTGTRHEVRRRLHKRPSQ